MASKHCTSGSIARTLSGARVLSALVVAAALASSPSIVVARAARQTIFPSISGASTLQFFLRGVPIGSEQVSVVRGADGWTISSTGRLADAVARRIEVRYTSDWRARDFTLDGTVRGQAQSVRTVVDGSTAKSQLSTNGQQTEKSDTIDPNAVLVLPTSFFGPFEAVAERLRTAPRNSEIPAYGVPAVSFVIRVGESIDEHIQTAARLIAARRTHLALVMPANTLEADIWTDETGRMIRFSIPAESLEVVRDDIASVASRTVPISRANDSTVRIPANGFVLVGTESRPTQSAAARMPAVVLVGGSGTADRDEMVAGIPVLGQIAGALAEAGFVVLRYDKRGIGQSGGRPEAASLADYAEDVRAAVKLLADRKDIDPRRIAVIGHSEGGIVALMAAAKDKRIAAVGLLATFGTTGAELVLAQQQRALDHSNLSDEEKRAKIELQKHIQEEILSGKSLSDLPPEVRKQVADNVEFQSLLSSNPAKIIPEVRQPLLIVQGELDTQVDPSNADRLEALARKRKHVADVEATKVPGVNHLLVPAVTGEVSEYGQLKDKHVDQRVSDAIVTWLRKTFGSAG